MTDTVSEPLDVLEIKDIYAALQRIRPYIPHTPLQRSDALSEICHCQVYVKFENLQRTGSFKERGALNKLLELQAPVLKRGVITASAGNHAQGLAYHGRRLGAPVHIVMPEVSPLIKIKATQDYGAHVILYGENYDEAYQRARELEQSEGLTFVHPFDDKAVIAGQGTIGLEILNDLHDVDAVLVAVGGGGLVAGIGCVIKNIHPQTEIIGVNTKAIPSMVEAFKHNKTVTVPKDRTIADGIAVRKVGDLCFSMAKKYIDRMVEVDDEEIANAILTLIEHEKTVAEGAGAAAMAALLHRPLNLEGKKVAVIVCGGNINVNLIARIIDRGLIKDGRRVRLSVILPDRPGMLAALLTHVAKCSANVLDVQHERSIHHIGLNDTEVSLVLETKGQSHADELLIALKQAGFFVKAM